MSTRPFAVPALAGSPDWLRLARRARLLSWLTLGWLGLEAGVGVAAAVIAGSELVAVSFWLLAPYIAAEGIQGLVSVSRPGRSRTR